MAVKWWLEKKREQRMQEKAKQVLSLVRLLRCLIDTMDLQAAIREELMTEYATAYYVMCKQLADAKGKPFDPIKVSQRPSDALTGFLT